MEKVIEQPRSRYLNCCGREIHYLEWGHENAPPLVMWHGLARTCRDFDDVSAALADTYRIICPDTIGRGLSQWSPNPDSEYRLAFYAQIAQSLVDQLGIEQMGWIGTSLGASVGTLAAATTLKGRINHLIFNDISPAPVVSSFAERIQKYLGEPAQFDTVTEFEGYLRDIYQLFGWQSDEQWRRMTETSVRRLPNGQVTSHYDTAFVPPFVAHLDDYILWDAYDTLRMPVLVLRGEFSDLLMPEAAQEMTQRGPRAKMEVISGCGHAPCLNVPDQIELVRKFLAE